MRTTPTALLLAYLAIACGSDDNKRRARPGPELPAGETEAIDGAGSPAEWLFLDEPFAIHNLAAGDGGNLVLIGSLYTRPLLFGGEEYPNVGGSDGLVATLSGAGQAGWGFSFGGIDADEPYAVAVRPSGNVVVGGFFRETMDLGDGPLVDLRTVAGFSDAYFGFDTGALLVFELDASGALVWHREFTSSTGEGAVSALGLAENGDVVLAGQAEGDLDFGAGPTAGNGIFMARLSASGVSLSSARFEGPEATVHGLAVEASGVVLAGSYTGIVDFGDGPLPDSGFDTHGFVTRLDATGALDWALPFGGAGDDRASAVALTGDGSAIVGGSFSSTLDLGEVVTRESETGFVAKLDASGDVSWTRTFAGSGASRVVSVVVDDDGHVIAGGGYRDGVDLGGGELPADTDDGFITGMAGSDGAHRFSRRIARFNFGGLARDGSSLYVAGTCEGVCTIGGEIVAPDATGHLLVAALSTDAETHTASWVNAAELVIKGETFPVRSAIAVPGSSIENPDGMTLIISAADLDCSAGSQIPRSVAMGEPRRDEPELALVLTSTELDWHSGTSWLSYDGGGNGGSAFALVRSISESEISAYVEHEVEAPGSSNTESYVIGNVTFERCF